MYDKELVEKIEKLAIIKERIRILHLLEKIELSSQTKNIILSIINPQD